MRKLKRKLELKSKSVARLTGNELTEVKGGDPSDFQSCIQTGCPGTDCWHSEAPGACGGGQTIHEPSVCVCVYTEDPNNAACNGQQTSELMVCVDTCGPNCPIDTETGSNMICC